MEIVKKYMVVIGDIISSRKVEKRNDLQKKLVDVFNDLNATDYENHLVSPYTITLGDEFQAVYEKVDLLFLDSIRILEKTFPQKIRFSFGFGEISTELNRKQSIGMDGSAFYLARDGIEKLKKKRGNYKFNVSGLEDPELEKLFNNSLFIFSNLLERWHKNRYFILTNTMAGKTVKEIAKELKLTETAVYKNIYDGSIREMMGYSGNHEQPYQRGSTGEKMIVYLLNVLMLSRIGYSFDDKHIDNKQIWYYLVIQILGLAVLTINNAWVIFIDSCRAFKYRYHLL